MPRNRIDNVTYYNSQAAQWVSEVRVANHSLGSSFAFVFFK